MALERPSAVRLFAPDHPALAHTLRARLEKKLQQLIEQLEYATDWADFNRRLGRVIEARETLAVASQIEQELKD